MIRESQTYLAIPPGETIKEQLSYKGMTQKEFATRMDMSQKHISKLINGEVELTTNMAVKLEIVLGPPASFWSGLEANYREKLFKVKEENSIDKDAELARIIPYNEMVKLNWVPKARKASEKANNLRKYFEVVELSLLENEKLTRVACRRLAINKKSDLAILAWAQKAKLIARECEVKPINKKTLVSLLPKIRKMTQKSSEVFCDDLKSMLADCGIALVFLPHLKGSYLQGATFIDGKKIVIGMTVRGKDADRFWFSLFHEFAHIILGHISKTNEISEKDEKAADEWAQELLIPSDKYCIFLENKNFSKDTIIEFSNQVDIAPGIVVGRLQNERLIEYNMLNDLKEKYEIIA